MKLLIATPLYPPDIGGPATYAKILGDELPKYGLSVRVVSFGEVRHFPKGLSHLIYTFRLFRALSDADVLLALDPVSVGLPAVFATALRRKKLVVKIVGDYAWEQGQQRFGVKVFLDEFVTMTPNKFLAQVRLLSAIQFFVASHASRIIVQSNYLKDIITKWGASLEKIVVVYNACDTIPVLPPREELRKKFGWNSPVLLSAGRLVPWKGFAPLVTLMAEIVKRHPRARLFIAGSGPLFSELKSKITETGMDSLVTLLGEVPKEKLMEYICAADCFVLNTGYEGLSHQLLEVLAIGTPIVTTNVGGNPEIVKDHGTGLLVGYNDTVALLGAIEVMLTDTTKAQQMATEGRRFVASFTIARMVKETISVLEKTISP